MDQDKKEEFRLFLTRKKLSKVTKEKYLLFFDKLQQILDGIGHEIDQSVVNAFLDIYPHCIANATLKNYLEFKGIRTLYLPKITGRKEVREQTTIPASELEAIRMALYSFNEKYGLIFDISSSCALRRQEVLSIKASDLEIVNGKMFLLIRMGKGNRQRKVFVNAEVQELILNYLKINQIKLNQYLFESTIVKDHPMNFGTWNKIFSGIAEAVTGKKYHPHQLRGSRATAWYNQGIDISSIQLRLGHSDISTTMLYIKPDKLEELKKWSNE